jgi:hypothetical protein
MGPQLSSRGYITVVLGVNCADKTQSVGNENQICCASALQAATDAVQTADNPYLSDSLTDRIGWSGYSAGSRAMINSHDDPGYGDPVNGPVRAIAGLDNIAIEQNGDDGSPFCGNIPQEPYATPTVPAMGLASGLTCNDGRPRTAKLTAWNHWRDAGVETMLLTFKNAGHGSFSGRGSTDSFKRSLSYYQGLWFDRWLKDDTDATAKLVNRDMLTVITNPASGASDDLLDPNWDSGVFMDGYDCATFQTSCTAP